MDFRCSSMGLAELAHQGIDRQLAGNSGRPATVRRRGHSTGRCTRRCPQGRTTVDIRYRQGGLAFGQHHRLMGALLVRNPLLTLKSLGARLHPITSVYCEYFLCDYLSGQASNRDEVENVSVEWVQMPKLTKFIPADRI